MINEELFELLDLDLSELADLEKFEPAPAGTYRAVMTWDKKEINEFPAAVLKLELKETMELANPSDVPPAPDFKVDIAMILKRKDKETNEIVPNKVGQGQLKEILLELAQTVGGTTPAEIMANSDGSEVYVTLKVRPNKNDPDQKFNTVKALALVS